ncbi:MAG: peptidase dimerization domain-containing protein [Pseudomonadota bacterium]|nr:MAG: hypothetical protein DIU59_16420 [Pseudomonadota bacterium]
MRDTPLRGRLTLAITSAGETGRHDAARAVLDAMDHVPDAAIIAIGTSGRLALANKGRIDVDVRVRGRAAHPSTPWAGIDAIAGARQVLDRVLALHVGTRHHPGLGRATLAATADIGEPWRTETVRGPHMFPAEIAADGPLASAIWQGCLAQGSSRRRPSIPTARSMRGFSIRSDARRPCGGRATWISGTPTMRASASTRSSTARAATSD